MLRSRVSPRSVRQRGAALLALVLFVFLAASAFVLKQGNAVGARNQADLVTASVMAQAKEALLGRAASDANRPGSLTCPDTDDDGVANQVGGACTSLLGRFPWKTLDIPEPLDGNADRLWYAISFKLRDHDDSSPLNSQQALQLSLDGAPNVAAIIFSPGLPLASQNGRPSNALGDYLDGSNSDGDDAYVAGLPSANFNDKALAITREELFRTVNQRILAEIRGPDDNASGPPSLGLRRYHAAHGDFPWADVDGDGFADLGQPAGALPFNDLELNALPLPSRPPYLWLNENGWLPLIAYQRLGPNSARLSIGTSTMTVVPCSSSPCP